MLNLLSVVFSLWLHSRSWYLVMVFPPALALVPAQCEMSHCTACAHLVQFSLSSWDALGFQALKPFPFLIHGSFILDHTSKLPMGYLSENIRLHT